MWKGMATEGERTMRKPEQMSDSRWKEICFHRDWPYEEYEEYEPEPDHPCANCGSCYVEKSESPCVDCRVLDSSKPISYWEHYKGADK